jgi:uncharacterized protein (UPF0333 family)
MKKSLMLAVLVVAIMLVVGVSSAFADTATITPAGGVATDTVTVKANVQAKIVLAVTTPANTQTVDFGNVYPGQNYSQSVSLAVWSNKGYTITESKVGDTVIGLTTSAITGAYPKTTLGENSTGHVISDTYSLNVPWNADPQAYTATVQYTVTQN